MSRIIEQLTVVSLKLKLKKEKVNVSSKIQNENTNVQKIKRKIGKINDSFKE